MNFIKKCILVICIFFINNSSLLCQDLKLFFGITNYELKNEKNSYNFISTFKNKPEFLVNNNFNSNFNRFNFEYNIGFSKNNTEFAIGYSKIIKNELSIGSGIMKDDIFYNYTESYYQSNSKNNIYSIYFNKFYGHNKIKPGLGVFSRFNNLVFANSSSIIISYSDNEKTSLISYSWDSTTNPKSNLFVIGFNPNISIALFPFLEVKSGIQTGLVLQNTKGYLTESGSQYFQGNAQNPSLLYSSQYFQDRDIFINYFPYISLKFNLQK